MGDLTSYAVADFIPFSAVVYFRLIENVSEVWWPLHLLTLTVGVSTAVLAWTGHTRSAGGFMAAAMAWVGATFLLDDYAQLNWAGTWFGWAFIVAAGLQLLSALSQDLGPSRSGIPRRDISIPGSVGLALVVFGVLLYPLIAPLTGNGWSQAEIFGIHPDPTAVTALGVALLTLHGYRLWLVAVVPMTWCLVSALTLQELQAPWAECLFLAIGVALTTMLGSSIARMASHSSEKPAQ